jgi:hypothetical protein
MYVKDCQIMVNLHSVSDEKYKRESSSISWYVMLYSLVEAQKRNKLSK